MIKLTQFEIPFTLVNIKGEYEGDEKFGKVVIFSHGFGVKRDSWGMFNELGDLLKDEYLVVRFDYNKISPEENSTYIFSYTTQTQILSKVLTFVNENFQSDEINIIAHSMGCLVVGLLSPSNISKIILNAFPVSSLHRRIKEYFSRRPGTKFTEEELSKIERSDGSWSFIDKSFWKDVKEVDPPRLYRSLAEKSKVLFIRALQDDVITNEDYEKIKTISRIKYLEIGGNHNFNDDNRKLWLELNVRFINRQPLREAPLKVS